MRRAHKFKHIPKNKIWFTGCTHIYHDKEFIWKARKQASIESHAQWILDTINETVKEDDTLFHLGDGFLTCTPMQVDEWLKKVRCKTIYYISGNHESQTGNCYDGERTALGLDKYEIYPIQHLNVIFLGPYVEASMGKRVMTLSHFPQLIWNKSHHGAWNIHSHCHGSLAQSLPYHEKAKRLDVGWDVFSRPVSFTEVDEIMARKEVEILDHHNSQTT